MRITWYQSFFFCLALLTGTFLVSCFCSSILFFCLCSFSYRSTCAGGRAISLSSIPLITKYKSAKNTTVPSTSPIVKRVAWKFKYTNNKSQNLNRKIMCFESSFSSPASSLESSYNFSFSSEIR